jgi:hypothetical protein
VLHHLKDARCEILESHFFPAGRTAKWRYRVLAEEADRKGLCGREPPKRYIAGGMRELGSRLGTSQPARRRSLLLRMVGHFFWSPSTNLDQEERPAVILS